jgi:hypothetical protein
MIFSSGEAALSPAYTCTPAFLWSNTHLEKDGDAMKRLIPILAENVELLKLRR